MTYSFRQSFPLVEMHMQLFQNSCESLLGSQLPRVYVMAPMLTRHLYQLQFLESLTTRLRVSEAPTWSQDEGQARVEYDSGLAPG